MDDATQNRYGQISTLARGRYRVLLIEDQLEDAGNLLRALNHSIGMRFEVTHVACLSEASRLLEVGQFDVVLADLYLPDSSGPAIITEIHERAPHVPVVALVRLEAESAAMEAMQAGAEDYYVKDSADSGLLVRVVRYVIERKSYTERLQFLEQAMQIREDLLASVSHDLRTPLTSIKAGLGLVEMSISERLGTEEHQLIANIRRNVERLGILVNDLLTFSEMEAHKFQLARKPLDLRVVVEDAVALIEPLVRKKGQVVEIDMPKAVPYNGDRKRLEQMLVNLLDNAHKYAHVGARITVSAQITPAEVLLAVRGDRPGLPIEEHEAIFAQFGHGHPVRSGEGLGLGLAMARSIVEMHGGRIWVEGQQGEGATFQIALPLPGEPPS
ncbi:MAG TPA: ATP-binding protein [Chloroflexia bacterium]|nr:ATP-binding protein [Chloroflexia bacterium]